MVTQDKDRETFRCYTDDPRREDGLTKIMDDSWLGEDEGLLSSPSLYSAH